MHRFFNRFKLSIPSLLLAVEHIVAQLAERAAEKTLAAQDKQERAAEIMADAERDMAESRLAAKMADKLQKLLS